MYTCGLNCIERYLTGTDSSLHICTSTAHSHSLYRNINSLPNYCSPHLHPSHSYLLTQTLFFHFKKNSDIGLTPPELSSSPSCFSCSQQYLSYPSFILQETKNSVHPLPPIFKERPVCMYDSFLLPFSTLPHMIFLLLYLPMALSISLLHYLHTCPHFVFLSVPPTANMFVLPFMNVFILSLLLQVSFNQFIFTHPTLRSQELLPPVPSPGGHWQG